MKIQIDIPKDEKGMLGRECLECEGYFKLKPGTGLATKYCHCPYCDYEGDADTFWTKDQIEYVRSVALQKAYGLIKSSLDDMGRELERASRDSLIKITVKTSDVEESFPIKYYSEKELETHITCDNCKLEFAVYDVFSRCPDCNKTNAFLIYESSLDVIKKQLDIFSKPKIPHDIQEVSLNSTLNSTITAFDELGQELRKIKPHKYSKKTKKIFQNLSALNLEKNDYFKKNHSNFETLLKLFQVKYCNEHNKGIITSKSATKIPTLKNMIGEKYLLTINELYEFLNSMRELGKLVKQDFEE